MTAERDLDEVAAGIARWLSSRRGVDDLVLTRCDRPADGLSSDTLMVDARGDARRRFVHGVRRRSASTLGRRRVPRVRPGGPGAGSERRGPAGHPGRGAGGAGTGRVVGRLGVHGDAGDLRVHPESGARVSTVGSRARRWTSSGRSRRSSSTCSRRSTASTGRKPASPVSRRTGASTRSWPAGQHYLDWYADGDVVVPRLADGLAWCAEHRPATDPPATLVWGDVRLGNVIFDDEQRPLAVLDWEMTGIGPPEQDLAWYFALDAIQHELFGRSVPGFLDRDAALARYEALLGRALVDLDWHDIFAIVRSTAIMTRLNVLSERNGQSPLLPLADNPFLDILDRRIEESSR